MTNTNFIFKKNDDFFNEIYRFVDIHIESVLTTGTSQI